jgi:TolB-like protein/tetratricopeptide (TPR) repeat protein
MSLREFFKELHHRNVFKVAVAYTAAAIVLLEVLTHLFHNFEAPQWVLKVITTLLIVGLPVACLMAWGFEFKESGVRSVPRVPKDSKPALPAPEATVPPSIAVLPFADMGAKHDQQYLGDGIAEELLNALASIEGLNVAARTSSFSFAGKGASMTEIGDTLHVRHVLEGSVRRAGQKLRITAQLIDVRSGFHLFTQSYDREVKDIFEIQNDIAREIVGALLPKLGISRDVMLVNQGTSNLEAYNLRLQARPWLTNPDPKTLQTAVWQLKQAITLDQHYADAWGDLAYVYGYTTVWAADPVKRLMKTSDAAANALRISPSNVMALLMQAYLSMVVARDPTTSSTYFRQARVAGVDESLWAFNKAYILDGPCGHYDTAIGSLEAAAQKDPFALNVKWALIDMYLASGRIAEAVTGADTLQQLGLKTPEGAIVSALAFVAGGQVSRALDISAALEAVSRVDVRGSPHLKFAINAATGKHAESKQLLDVLLLQSAEGRPVSSWLIGAGYKALGDYEQAVESWRHAVDKHEPLALTRMPIENRNHPVIGKHPGFLVLLRRMGLEGAEDTTAVGQ